MARTNKPSKTVSESSSSQQVSQPDVVVAPVSAETSAPSEPKVKKAKKTKAEKEVAPVVETSVVVPQTSAPVVPDVSMTTVVSEDVEPVVDADVPIAEQSLEYLAKLQQITQLMSSLKAEFRTLEKKWSREIKSAQKLNSRRKRKSGNRAPSGFVKPTRISDELASFLGKEKGTEMARTAVTRDINLYIRNNNLQDKTNGRKIIPDDKLASLLKLEKTDELTYFNLQKYMSPHFAKNKVVEATATA